MAKRTCSIPECDGPVVAHDLCQGHYDRLRRTGTTDGSMPGWTPKPACSVEGCDKTARTLSGPCRMHYDRMRVFGSYDDPRPTSEQRFWAKVDKHGPVPEHRPELGPCWIWTGAHMPLGYGTVRVNWELLLTHRYAYKLLVGPIPDGLTIDHLCRVPACVKPIADEYGPAHTEPVTHAENVRRGRAGWNTRERTTCKQGHPLVYVEAIGQRVCPPCKRQKAAEAARRRRAAKRGGQ